jgi:BlaI family transcriptional regulator, penicillinase repressor
MAKQRRLTEAEWEVMDGVWHLGTRTVAREVHAHVYPQGQKAFSTVQTVLGVLCAKGFLKKEKFGRILFFTPAVTREEVRHQETRTLVSRLYQGSFGALVTHLVGQETISPKELEEIKAQIEARSRERKQRGG